MSKIDIDKFVTSLIEFSPQQSMKYIKAITDQGLEYKDGEIVEIPYKSEDERMRKALIRFFQWFPYDRLNDENLKPEEAIAWLEKQGEQKEYIFKSLPRLLDMIEPTSKAKTYCQKLIDTLVKEGYSTDAKIVSDCLKKMNGEKVAMVTMDEQNPTKWSEEDQEMLDNAVYACQKVYRKDSDTAYWLQSLKQRIEK